ncbi:MAG: Smr/MutS family protein [Bacteroidota bacterium]
MARPHLSDDGQTVTLDLHGAHVDEAIRLVEAVVVQAARYGRPTLKIVHGTSTADLGHRRTIKDELRDRLDTGEYDRHVTSSYLTDGAMTLGLAPAPRPIQGHLRLSDLA